MLSKCANPECSERFLYLHQGRLFQLSPTPDMHAAEWNSSPLLYERFWLCDRCSKEMTIAWGGTEAKLVPLEAKKVASKTPDVEHADFRRKSRKRIIWAGPSARESARTGSFSDKKSLERTGEMSASQQGWPNAGRSGLNDLLQRRTVPDDKG